MKNTPYIKKTFGTKLTVRQLNEAVRLGALLLGGEVDFYGQADTGAELIINCSELSGPFIVMNNDESVEFQFAEADHRMLACIRLILDADLMFELTTNHIIQTSADELSFDRIGA
jgi:hypothetical protein